MSRKVLEEQFQLSQMDQTKWQKIEELFNAVLELPAEKQSAYLDSYCKNNELRKEVESLLKNADKEDSFLGKPNFSLGLAILGQEKKHLLDGKKLGRYQIIRLLGEGGMGEVYLAEDLQLNRKIALKLLPAYLVEDNESVSRFQKEALAASSVSHPNIAHVYEAGFEENHRYIAMEFVEGTTLRELINQKRLDVITTLDIILQTANALASAHQSGIIHRDIKPENIMIRSDGYIKVLDFGIAKLSKFPALETKNSDPTEENPRPLSRNLQVTNPALVMGTIGYISPEQLTNNNVDLRTDVWSLGVVLYEILSGNKPFTGKTIKAITKAISKKKPLLFSVSTVNSDNEATLQKILTKALRKKAEDRYQSMSEMSQDIKDLKQKIELSQRFSTGEIYNETGSLDARITDQTHNPSFITKSRLFWSQQSLSKKTLLLAVFIGILTFTVGSSLQYFGRIYPDKVSKFRSFSSESREKWQISTLFGIRKKMQGFISSVSFSPDGNSIAFAMSAEGAADIYVKQLNQNEPTKLTDSKWIYQTPIWSPDGQQIAFVSNRDNKIAIWTISSHGGVATLKTNLNINISLCELLKWSNDGKRLFFKSSRALKVLELDSGQIREITFPVENSGWNFSISNDESLIAFMSLEGEKRKLWVHNLQTGELKEIANQTNSNFSPVFFSDNKRLIFSSNQSGNSQLYITDLANDKPTQITFGNSNAFSPIISTDGRRLVYVSETNTANIFALDLVSQKEMRLTEETQMQLFPDLSKDLTNLVFQITDDTDNFLISPLKIKNMQTSRESFLENQAGFWAKWSPAKVEIAYIKDIGGEYNIWKTDLTNNQVKQLTFGGIWVGGNAIAPFNLMTFPFDWSSDGNKITFVSNRSKVHDVWTIDSDGTNSQKLTDNDNPKLKYSSPMWSPDGSKIAFDQRLEIQPKQYEYGVAIGSNNQTKKIFHNHQEIRLLGWSANDSLLASVDKSNEIEIYELSETADPKLLTKLYETDFYSLTLSPDGKTIAYSARRNAIDNIFSFSTSAKEKQLTDNREDTILFSGILWSPAGDRIFYSKQSGGIQISMISDNSESSE